MNISDIAIMVVTLPIIAGLLIMKFVMKMSWKEIWVNLAEPFKSQSNKYELEYDVSYQMEINDICKNIMGEQKYSKLCKLNSYEPLIHFWYSAGYPLVYITVNFTEENEQIQLENIILQTTKSYLTNYCGNYEVIVEWGRNQSLGLPMMIIGYARNKQENKAILRKKNEELTRILNSSIDVIDDTEDLL